MNEPYSEATDKIISDLLDNYEFTEISPSGCTVKLGTTWIWVGNIPYSCMYPERLSNSRPSRLTIQKGVRKFLKVKTELEIKKYLDSTVNL